MTTKRDEDEDRLLSVVGSSILVNTVLGLLLDSAPPSLCLPVGWEHEQS